MKICKNNVKIHKIFIRIKYDYIFFATEDDNIKKKFLPEFKDKIKLLKS